MSRDDRHRGVADRRQRHRAVERRGGRDKQFLVLLVAPVDELTPTARSMRPIFQLIEAFMEKAELFTRPSSRA